MSTYKTNLFRKGLLPLIILSLLDQEAMYGYQLVKAVAEKSGGVITTQEGALYPILYSFTTSGYIREEKVQTHVRQFRYYYHLTEEGKKYLETLKEEYRLVDAAMQAFLQ